MDEQLKSVILFLTIFLIFLKATISVYLAKKIQMKKKRGVVAGVKFLTGTMIMLLGLLISRIIFVYFDFVLTDFNDNNFPIYPNYVYWKVAMSFAAITLIYLLWVLDKVVMQNKFKGIPSIVTLLIIILVILLPVNSLDDFKLISMISTVVNIAALFIPGIFFYVAKKSSGTIRRNAFNIAIGILIYAISAVIVNESIVGLFDTLLGFQTRALLWWVSIIGKSIGLSLFSISSVKFASD